MPASKYTPEARRAFGRDAAVMTTRQRRLLAERLGVNFVTVNYWVREYRVSIGGFDRWMAVCRAFDVPQPTAYDGINI